jgi:hypothetical protein
MYKVANFVKPPHPAIAQGQREFFQLDVQLPAISELLRHHWL